MTRVERPPLGWRALTLAVFGLAAVHVVATVVSIILLVQDYQLVKRLAVDSSSVSQAEIDALVELQLSTSPVIYAAFIVYIVAYLLWFTVTARTVDRYGGDRKAVLSHWALIAWRVVIIGVFLVAFLTRDITATDLIDRHGNVQAALDFDRLVIAFAALRFPVVALLLVGVQAVARRVEGLTANPPPRSVEHRWEEVGPSASVLSRSAVKRGPGDDAYWQQVADAVARSSGPLPLLEAWAAAPGCRRWYLLTDEFGVAAVRSRLSPWSGITVYGVPPCPPGDAVLRHLADEAHRPRDDQAAGGAIGLIEEEGGKVRFEQLTSEEALLSWLDRAGAASRIGIYPVQPAADPAALISA